MTQEILETKILTSEDLILKSEEIYTVLQNYFSTCGYNLISVWNLIKENRLKDDGSIFFYNVIQICKYFSLNKTHGF